MPSQEYLDKMQLHQNFRNLWHTDLMSTIQQDPLYCCLAFWRGPCVSYMLRKRALYNDMSRYTCCAGYMPCTGRFGERKCPEFCLCTEIGTKLWRYYDFGLKVVPPLMSSWNCRDSRCLLQTDHVLVHEGSLLLNI